MKKTKIIIPEGLSPAQIKEEYNVSHATAWRASKRGWLHQNYHGDQSGAAVKAGIAQKFVRLVQHPAINMAQLTSLKKQKILDIIAGKSTLREPDWIRFKAEWAEIRNLLRTFERSGNVTHLKQIYQDARIKPFILFENRKMLERLAKDLQIYDHELARAKSKIKEFLNKTQI